MASFKTYLGIIIILLGINLPIYGQFSPQAGLPGSSAIPANCPAIKFWANNAKIIRGYLNISDTNYEINGSNRVSFGTEENATGQADGQVVSLGDGGSAILSFDVDICDGEGWDFAIFENGFRSRSDSNLAFLELAFVEVSSDGQHFYRFPSISLTQDSVQISGFGFLDSRKIHNLAGKYIKGFGTPFDLADLQNINSPFLKLKHIKFIKIIDVVGSINTKFSRYDSRGNIINDPFPTPYPSGGFDLDAVGVKNFATLSYRSIKLYPNPAKDNFNIWAGEKITKVDVYNALGKKIFSKKINNNNFVQIFSKNWSSGLYFCLVYTKIKLYEIKLIKL